MAGAARATERAPDAMDLVFLGVLLVRVTVLDVIQEIHPTSGQAIETERQQAFGQKRQVQEILRNEQRYKEEEVLNPLPRTGGNN